MKIEKLTTIAIAFASSLMCATGFAKDPEPRPEHRDAEFVFERHENGKKQGEIIQERSTKDLAEAPLVNTFTSLDGSSSVVTIRYVGYADFHVDASAKNAKNEQVGPGHVFAVQILKGKKGVTIKTAEKNVTKLVIYQNSPQIMHQDGDVSVTIRNKNP
jgi:hypothetical protein